MIHGPLQCDSGSTLIPNDSFGRPSSSRSVEYIQIICAFHFLAWYRFEFYRFKVQFLPLRTAFYSQEGSLFNDYFGIPIGYLNGFSENLNVVHFFVGFQSATCCNYQNRFGIDDSTR